MPYLNGGLFEEDEDDKDEKIKVPDKAIGAVLNDLFANFNFTVTESTPLDVEVAVDPEMLGRIFEELVTGRHETGSYYTPKPIVSFMCREALKGYLGDRCRPNRREAVERFVDKHSRQTAQCRDRTRSTASDEGLRSCLRQWRVPVGMLHELLDLRAAYLQSPNWTAYRSTSESWRSSRTMSMVWILTSSPSISRRLRLWLSLSVDFEGQSPPPLPNLDYKVEAGDTICSPNPSGFQLGFRKSLIDDYLKAKSEYITAHHARKIELRKTIAALRADIATWSHRGRRDFDWPIDFAEVFVSGGFDVVLANPPYVRMESFKEIKPDLKKNFPNVHADTRRPVLLFLRQRHSNSSCHTECWCSFPQTSGSEQNTEKNFVSTFTETCADISSITDFCDLPVFESATPIP